MKFRIGLSVLLIGILSATAFAATRSALSSQVTLAANTFSTGTIDLQISKSTSTSPTSFTDTSIAGFSGNILPDQTVSEPVWLKNASGAVDFAVAGQTASVSGEIAPANVTVTLTPVSSDGTVETGSPVSGTLTDWESVKSLGSTIAHGAKQRYRMDIHLASSVSTAGSINFDFIFTGTQTP